MDVRAIIFDCNGVISDDEPQHFLGMQRALAEEGIAITHAQYLERYLAHDDRGAMAGALRDAGRAPTADKVAALSRNKRRYYAELVEKDLRIFPGVAAFVRAAAVRYATAIGSGALRPEIDLILDKAGIADCFRVIVSAEEIERCKPAPDCYLRVLEKLRARPELASPPLQASQCFVIEDSRGGVAAARAAGMRVAAVTNSYSAAELDHADFVLPTLQGMTPESLVARLK